MISSGATFGGDYSPRTWRYELHRIWSSTGGRIHFICLNPSTADETDDDPTMRRLIGFARAYSFGGLVVTNLFSWCATDPHELARIPAPAAIGYSTDRFIVREAKACHVTVAAWGNGGALHGRGQAVRDLLLANGIHPRTFGLTRKGQPKHPLYLKASTDISMWL